MTAVCVIGTFCRHLYSEDLHMRVVPDSAMQVFEAMITRYLPLIDV